jgi:hypothetical protein
MRRVAFHAGDGEVLIARETQHDARHHLDPSSLPARTGRVFRQPPTILSDERWREMACARQRDIREFSGERITCSLRVPMAMGTLSALSACRRDPTPGTSTSSNAQERRADGPRRRSIGMAESFSAVTPAAFCPHN